ERLRLGKIGNEQIALVPRLSIALPIPPSDPASDDELQTVLREPVARDAVARPVDPLGGRTHPAQHHLTDEITLRRAFEPLQPAVLKLYLPKGAQFFLPELEGRLAGKNSGVVLQAGIAA